NFAAGTQCKLDTSSSIAREPVLCASHIMSTRKFEQLSASSKTRTRFQVAMGGNVFSPSSPLGGVCTSTDCPGRGAGLTDAPPAAQATHPAMTMHPISLRTGSRISPPRSVRVRQRHAYLDATLVTGLDE